MQKKIVALILSGALCTMALAGCGNDDAASDTASESSSDSSAMVDPTTIEPEVVHSVRSTAENKGDFVVSVDAVTENGNDSTINCDGIINYLGEGEVQINVSVDADKASPSPDQTLTLHTDSYMPWRASWNVNGTPSADDMNGRTVTVTITPVGGEALTFELPIVVDDNAGLEDGAMMPEDDGIYEDSMTIE